jgi:hypothetical protein
MLMRYETIDGSEKGAFSRSGMTGNENYFGWKNFEIYPI